MTSPLEQWEVECSCGAGMPEPTEENIKKGYVTSPEQPEEKQRN